MSKIADEAAVQMHVEDRFFGSVANVLRNYLVCMDVAKSYENHFELTFLVLKALKVLQDALPSGRVWCPDAAGHVQACANGVLSIGDQTRSGFTSQRAS